jgi:flagellar biosynthesis GTPase FlhF
MESLRLKSYFSGTVEAAMDLARRELGGDALLIDARPSLAGTRHLGAYEVVFGITDRSIPIPPPLGTIHERGGCAAGAQPIRPAHVSMLDGYESLLDKELDPSLAQAVSQGTPLEDLFTTNAALSRVTMLVGPPGAGKTSTLMKLATRYGTAAGRRTQILTTPSQRAAKADHLRGLAAAAGIGCEAVNSPAALSRALDEYASTDLIFIDTPGFALREMEAGAELARAAIQHTGIDTHLVLPASMRSADMARVADAYGWFHPAKLIFTRVDETARYGALVSESARQELPISFLGTGQRIPEDLEPATRRRLLALVFDRSAGNAHRQGAGA